jgi:hypothetical protein
MSSSQSIIREKWVLPLALAAFLVPVAAFEWYVCMQTDGIFSYPLDDTFIHMAIAKTLAFQHVWGVSGHEFSSASSSVLYPVILATAFYIFGLHTTIPFIINIMAGTVLIVVIHRWLKVQDIKPAPRLIIMLAMIVLTPFHSVVMCGMEHTLQFLFSFLFITRFARECSAMQERSSSKIGLSWSVYLYGALLVGIRYECMTLVGTACLILLFQRRWRISFQLGIISLLPILIFGIYAMLQGSYFMPNSIVVKSVVPPNLDAWYLFITQHLYIRLSLSMVGYIYASTQNLLVLLPFCYLLFARQIRENLTYKYLLILLMTAIFAQLAFTALARYPRYEAYLFGCSVVISGTLLVKFGVGEFRRLHLAARWVAVLMGLLILVPMYQRSKNAFLEIAQACINIYEQQYQMGQFAHRYYDKNTLAIGDLGAVSYFSEGRKVDLVGLGDIRVARSRKMNYYTPEFLYNLSKKEGTQVAIIYDSWYDSTLWLRWPKVATWTIPNNVICGDSIVSFYAVDSSFLPGLKKNLVDFQPSLPHEVRVKYY